MLNLYAHGLTVKSYSSQNFLLLAAVNISQIITFMITIIRNNLYIVHKEQIFVYCMLIMSDIKLKVSHCH